MDNNQNVALGLSGVGGHSIGINLYKRYTSCNFYKVIIIRSLNDWFHF